MKYFVHYPELINKTKRHFNFSTFAGMATGELENLFSPKFPIQSRDYNHDTLTNLPKNCANDLIFDEKPNLNELKGHIKEEKSILTEKLHQLIIKYETAYLQADLYTRFGLLTKRNLPCFKKLTA